MTMILKIMLHDENDRSGAGFPDDSPYASFHIHDGVKSVNFSDPPGDHPYAMAQVTFDDDTVEIFSVPGNAYLMNSNGKTIAHYAGPPRNIRLNKDGGLVTD